MTIIGRYKDRHSENSRSICYQWFWENAALASFPWGCWIRKPYFWRGHCVIKFVCSLKLTYFYLGYLSVPYVLSCVSVVRTYCVSLFDAFISFLCVFYFSCDSTLVCSFPLFFVHSYVYMSSYLCLSQIRCWEVQSTGQTIPKAQQTHQGPVLDVAWSDVSLKAAKARCCRSRDKAKVVCAC